MVTDERRAKLLEMVRLRGFASLSELASELSVSESTVRRDLDYLEELGTAKRTHGGVFYTGPSPQLPHFQQRQRSHWELKKEIARRAAELIEDGDTILLDGGSTTYELARLLIGRSVQVVTNSLPVANLFSTRNFADVILIGGYVHSGSGVLVGPHAREMVTKLHVPRMFLSVAGINEQGYFNANVLVVETEQAMMEAADETVVLADSSKFGRQSLSLLCGLGDVSTVIVDHQITESWRSKITESGSQLIVAELPSPVES